jgi:hypothetical protein
MTKQAEEGLICLPSNRDALKSSSADGRDVLENRHIMQDDAQASVRPGELGGNPSREATPS